MEVVKFRIWYIISITFVALTIPSYAKIIYVDDNASAGGKGTSWSSARKYLQDALSNAEYGDEIWVAEGIYKPNLWLKKSDGDKYDSFNLVNGVGMYGGFKGTETKRTPLGDTNKTILSGEISDDINEWSLHVISCEGLDSNTSLDGFLITKGRAVRGKGGGMIVSNSSLIVRNCIFNGNYGGSGGGMSIDINSFPIVENCVFENNTGWSAGAVYISSNTMSFSPSHYDIARSSRFKNCKFLSNRADSYGGAIRKLAAGWLSFFDCVFEGNSAGISGGAIQNNNSIGSYFNCVFMDNSAGGTFTDATKGGAIYNDSGLVLMNCIFSKNRSSNSRASAQGGALFSTDTNFKGNGLILKNCIFTKNAAVGISDFRSRQGAATFGVTKYTANPATVNNCIFWKNMTFDEESHGCGSEDSGYWKSDSVPEADNIMQGWQGDTRAFTSDPMFLDIDNPRGPDGEWFTSDDGLQVRIGSPAIDNGHNILLPYDSLDLDKDGKNTDFFPVDVLGLPRFQGESVDIGAYEYPDENVNISVQIIPVGAGIVDGGGIFPRNSSILLRVKAVLPGYQFAGWEGDINETSHTVSLIADSSKRVIANFAQELNDSDNDGLSDYEEIAIYGTSIDQNDTDGDGLFDNEEILIGSDPNISNLGIVNYLNSKAKTNQDNALITGQIAGIELVKANPSTYGLYSSADVNVSIASALSEANPATARAITNAKTEGESSVTSNPSAYNLVTQSAYDEMMNELMSASNGDTTPYSEGWFYLPNQGWLWTTRTTYPYFFDSTSKAWMYFQSGNEKPRFYHYGTKTWMTVE